MKVPFFRPEIGQAEIDEVVSALKSGWLTTGPRVKRFEREFADAVGGSHAVAVNSCTAALHLAVEALELKPGQGVLIPTMTFAATGEIVRYMGGVPILVDCEPGTLNIDLEDAERKLARLRAGHLAGVLRPDTPVVGIIPVHVGGLLMNTDAVRAWAKRRELWVVEDAAHAFPASWRQSAESPWRRCGESTAVISCFSFYANKTITTGEGGMAVTENAALADRMRLMSLHGLSQDAWERYSGGKSWDYRIVAPGFKYNMNDVAAAIGIHQLARAESMRLERESVARRYTRSFREIEELEPPADDPDRIHSWHLYPIRLRTDRLSIDRNAFMDALKDAGIGCSVHWRPL
ncbi:MAG TPA: DegT/DnrJ/EryC1/StrS family aminotransferase, partial [Thermoanaerobaculia bacterium]|nr:DegT/DnrJ/EryC1/StrS family aminotransferase [Thermoanaerobaculia bacterium]